MSSAASMFNSNSTKFPSPVSISDECQVHLKGEMNERQIDREQNIRDRKINLAWGALITGAVVAIGGIFVAYIKAKE